MSTDSKACFICGATMHRPPKKHAKDWEKVLTCGTACAQKLRLQRLYPNGHGRTRDRITEGAYSRHKKNQALRLKEGKRAPLAPDREWDIDRVDTKSEAYQKQLAIDTAWRKSIECKAGPVKCYTPEEIAAIQHEITPIEKVRSTTREAILFAEPDPTFKYQRHEESGTLFSRRD